MDLLAFVLALQAEGKTAEEVKAAVDQYLEDNPGAIDQAAVEAILDGRLDDIVLAQQNQPTSEDNRIWFPTSDGGTVQVPTYQEHSGLKSAIEDLEAGSLSALGATAGQVPVADGNGSWTWGNVSGGGSTVVLQITEDSENVLHLGKSYNDLKAMANSGMNIVAIWKQDEDYYRWYPLTELEYSDTLIPPYECIFGFSFDEDSLGFGSSTATDELIMQTD